MCVTLYALVYVDRILITSSSRSLIHDLICKHNSKFALKDLGHPKYFLGVEVKFLSNLCMYMHDSIKIHQGLLHRASMSDASCMPTPMANCPDLTKYGSDSLNDPFMHRSIVRAVQYVTLTRPGFSFAVNKVCHFPLLFSQLTGKRLKGFSITCKTRHVCKWRTCCYFTPNLYHLKNLQHFHLLYSSSLNV